MVVLGKHSFIFEKTGRTCNVEPFSTHLWITQNIPIVNAVILYDCVSTHQTYILLITLQWNTTFYLRLFVEKDGLIVNDAPNIYCKDPAPDNHCITFSDSDLCIPLLFWLYNSITKWIGWQRQNLHHDRYSWMVYSLLIFWS